MQDALASSLTPEQDAAALEDLAALEAEEDAAEALQLPLVPVGKPHSATATPIEVSLLRVRWG